MSTLQKLIDESKALAGRMSKRAADLAPIEISWEVVSRPESLAKELRAKTRDTEGKEYFCVKLVDEYVLAYPNMRAKVVREIETEFRMMADRQGFTLAPPSAGAKVDPNFTLGISPGRGGLSYDGAGTANIDIINRSLSLLGKDYAQKMDEKVLKEFWKNVDMTK